MERKQIIQLLNGVSSQDPDVLKEAEQHLRHYSNIEGFYTELARVAVSLECSEVIRFQAALLLKNSIDRIWRKSRSCSEEFELSNKEKSIIRNVMLHCLDEPSDRVSVQHAVIVSKTARLDGPSLWPELLPVLAEAIEMSDASTVKYKRALQVLYKVIKMMASKRLAVDRRRFQELTKLVFVPICNLLETHLASFRTSRHHDAICIKICLQCIKYMVLYGVTDLPNHNSVCGLLGNLRPVFQQITSSAMNATLECSQKKALWSSAVQICKMIRGLIDMNPSVLVPWLADVISLCYEGAVSDDEIIDKLRIGYMNNLKLILLCQDYKVLRSDTTGTDSKHSSAEDKSTQASLIIQTFFNKECLCKLCESLVERLILGKEELELWISDPESFDLQQSRDSDSWEYQIKPCSASLYSTVVHEFWDVLASMIQQWLTYLNEPLSFEDEKGILRKDAVLCCLCLAAQDLLNAVDFRHVFRELVLSPAVWIPAPPLGCKILQRRLLWLTEKWILFKFDKDLRPELYQLIVNVIHAGIDLAVQLAACSTLKEALDDFEFDLDQFLPYARNTIEGLINLLKSCSEDDTRMKVVSCITLLSERCGHRLKHQLDPLLSFLPQLWNTDHHLLKNQMLVLLAHLVTSAGADCREMEDGLCQLISTAVNTENPGYATLLEDGLDLWLSLVQNYPAPLSECMIQLFYCMPNLLTIQSEFLKICLDIVVAYATFRSQSFNQMYVGAVFSVFGSIVPEMRSEGILATLKACRICLLSAGPDYLPCAQNLLQWCFKCAFRATKESLAVQLSCLSIISDALLMAPPIIRPLIESCTPDSEAKNFGDAFMQVWLKKMSEPSCALETKKRASLAVCSLLSLDQELIVSGGCFPDIISSLTELLHDLCVVAHDGTATDTLMTNYHRDCAWEEGDQKTEHDYRAKLLKESDPVYTVPYSTALCRSLRKYSEAMPPEHFQVLWQSVDIECRQKLDTLKG